MSTIFPPTEVTSAGASSIARTSIASQPGCGTASLLRKMTLRPGARNPCSDPASEAIIFSERQQAYLRIFPGDRSDAAVFRAVVDNGHGRGFDICCLREHSLEAGERVPAAVPVDDDDIDSAQDAPPMRRFSRARIDGGRSGTCMRTAKASLFVSMRGLRQKSRNGCSASGH